MAWSPGQDICNIVTQRWAVFLGFTEMDGDNSEDEPGNCHLKHSPLITFLRDSLSDSPAQCRTSAWNQCSLALASVPLIMEWSELFITAVIAHLQQVMRRMVSHSRNGRVVEKYLVNLPLLINILLERFNSHDIIPSFEPPRPVKWPIGFQHLNQ